MPAPAVASSRPQRHLIIDSIWEVLEEGMHKTNINNAYRNKMTDVFRGLSGMQDDAYPAMALELTSAIAPNAPSSALAVIINALASSNEETIRALHAHRHYLAADPKRTLGFMSMRRTLTEKLGITPDQDGYMPSVETHLYAKARFTEIKQSITTHRHDEYQRDIALMQKVEQYPDHVSELMDYIARGQDDPTLEGFEDYLAGGAVREGTL